MFFRRFISLLSPVFSSRPTGKFEYNLRDERDCYEDLWNENAELFLYTRSKEKVSRGTRLNGDKGQKRRGRWNSKNCTKQKRRGSWGGREGSFRMMAKRTVREYVGQRCVTEVLETDRIFIRGNKTKSSPQATKGGIRFHFARPSFQNYYGLSDVKE